jgi:hypothetical protein
MDAAAFFSIEGGLRDKLANGEHILELPALGGIELLIHNVSLPEFYHIDGLLQFGRFPVYADASPHK